MKLIGYKNGKKVLYIERKDMILYDLAGKVKEKEMHDFVRIKDKNLRKKIIKDKRLIDFREIWNLNMKEITNEIYSLDSKKDKFQANAKYDLERIYNFKLGSEKIKFPFISAYKECADIVNSAGITYMLWYSIDPFAILIEKEDGEEMLRTDRYPEDAIETQIGIIATSLGLSGNVDYKADIKFSNNGKIISFGANFPEYYDFISKQHKKNIKQNKKRKK